MYTGTDLRQKSSFPYPQWKRRPPRANEAAVFRLQQELDAPRHEKH